MRKIVVDILMGAAIVMEFLSLPIFLHEIIGIGLVFLIIIHIKLNKNYFKRIFKGKYNIRRANELIINIGLLISLTVTIISGVITSQSIMKDMKIGNHKISEIHKSSSFISLIFLGLHLLVTHKKLSGQIKKLN